MGFSCGIVGLPNVGKSTIFNVLLKKQNAEASNYPFCTIEPNIGQVGVKDIRLTTLADMASSDKRINAQLKFVDIAGLVPGASKGEGLGNKFLGNIREVDAIMHVLRCFVDKDIIHVDESGDVNPLRDKDIIETELMIADLESVEKQLSKTQKGVKSGDKEMKAKSEILSKIKQTLDDGNPARNSGYSIEELKPFNLITAKPTFYVCNVGEDESSGNNYTDMIKENHADNMVIISAKIEEEMIDFEDEEKLEYMKELNMKEAGLDAVTKKGYEILGLETFFTVGPKESRAWTMKIGTKAPQAAGIIHTDFERGFIKAEIIDYKDYIDCQGEAKAKETGKMRLEGKEYIMKDGDIVHFKFNV